MTPKPRKRYQVSYPGYDTCTLNIITENLDMANQGDRGMQASIAWQYFKALGYDRPPSWDWQRFTTKPTGQTGRPPRHTPTIAQQETYGCTCERDCASCEQGWHKSCRYGCQYGQKVQ